MKVLLAGAGGQAGWELRRTAPPGVRLLALDSAALDITDQRAVAEVVAEERPAVIINAAAYTAVDRAESEPGRAVAVNSHGVANLAGAARENGARLVQISTDFVFDGLQSRPYAPNDPPNPLGVYGGSKLAGEAAVRQALGDEGLIVRTAWLYSSHGHNFVKTMLRLFAGRDEVRVVADQIGTPTWARGLAETIWRLTEIGASGIHHWTDAGVAGWYDFACAIQEEALALGLLSRAVPVVPVTTSEYPTPARRPACSVLDKTKTRKLLGGPVLHWRVQLRHMLAEYRELSAEN